MGHIIPSSLKPMSTHDVNELGNRFTKPRQHTLPPLAYYLCTVVLFLPPVSQSLPYTPVALEYMFMLFVHGRVFCINSLFVSRGFNGVCVLRSSVHVLQASLFNVLVSF